MKRKEKEKENKTKEESLILMLFDFCYHYGYFASLSWLWTSSSGYKARGSGIISHYFYILTYCTTKILRQAKSPDLPFSWKSWSTQSLVNGRTQIKWNDSLNFNFHILLLMFEINNFLWVSKIKIWNSNDITIQILSEWLKDEFL